MKKKYPVVEVKFYTDLIVGNLPTGSINTPGPPMLVNIAATTYVEDTLFPTRFLSNLDAAEN